MRSTEPASTAKGEEREEIIKIIGSNSTSGGYSMIICRQYLCFLRSDLGSRSSLEICGSPNAGQSYSGNMIWPCPLQTATFRGDRADKVRVSWFSSVGWGNLDSSRHSQGTPVRRDRSDYVPIQEKCYLFSLRLMGWRVLYDLGIPF